MILNFLGTGSAYPTHKRFVSSLAIKLEDGSVLLFDCGEGSQIQIQKINISPCKIKKIFITHLHGDHVFGLPGLLCTMSSHMMDQISSLNFTPLIEIYGPIGLRMLINTSLYVSNSFLCFNYKINELEVASCQIENSTDLIYKESAHEIIKHPNEIPGSIIKPTKNSKGELTWSVYENENHSVEAGWISHCVPCFGFVLKEKERPGTLLVEKLKSLGIPPGPLYGKLKIGQKIEAPSGLSVKPQDVMTLPHPGRVIAILGDTSDGTTMAHITNHCDVLVHEATHDDSLKEKALKYGHSTPKVAANLALKMRTKTLIMNHFSQRYSDEDCINKECTTSTLKSQALQALEGSDISVHCAFDFFSFEVKRQNRNLQSNEFLQANK